MEKKWKRAFFALMCLLLVFLGTVIFLSLKPLGQGGGSYQELDSNEKIYMDLSLKGQDLEKIFAREMEARGIKGSLTIEGEFLFAFPVKALGQDLNLSLVGEPRIGQDGELEIVLSKIRVGHLKLPRKLALNILAQVIPDEGPMKFASGPDRLLVDLSSIGSGGYLLKAKEIDIEKDRFVFSLEIQGERGNINKEK